jgi:superfamily II DNA or RNA helicase
MRDVELDKFSGGLSYQQESVEALLKTNDGILCLRTGAGKTLVGLYAGSLLRVPILVVVKNDGLGVQWEEAILRHTHLSREDIGHIDGTHTLDFRKPIVIASVQTLAKRAKENRLDPEILHWFGLLLLDEAHTMGAPHFNSAIPPFHGRRWGLTATPDRTDQYLTLLNYTLGDVVYTHLMPDVMPEVTFVQLPTKLNLDNKEVRRATHVWKRETNPTTGKPIDGSWVAQFHYTKTFGYLSTLEDRNNRILRHIRKAVDCGRQVMVISQSKAACIRLSEMYPGSGLVIGSVKGKERHRRIEQCNPIFVVDQLGTEAVDKSSLDTLFFVDPLKDSRRLQQGMGRVLRAGSASAKKRMVIFFEDAFIRQLSIQCGKARRLLAAWPEAKGGAIPYRITREELK